MELFFCLVLPAILVIVFVVWLVRRKPAAGDTASQLMTPAALIESNAFGGVVEQMLDQWVDQGRLPREAAEQVLALLREDRAMRAQPAATPPAAVPPLQTAVAPAAARPPFQPSAAAPAAASVEAAPTPQGAR